LLIDSLLIPIVESTYLNVDTVRIAPGVSAIYRDPPFTGHRFFVIFLFMARGISLQYRLFGFVVST